MTDADRDISFLTLVCFAEASSEGRAGMDAQVWSVINRHKAVVPGAFPAKLRWYARATLTATVLLGYAYSAMNTADPNRVRAAETSTADPIYAMAEASVRDALGGITQDPTDGATHYYREGTPEPGWVKGVDATGKQVAPPATFTRQIGVHLFYKDVT